MSRLFADGDLRELLSKRERDIYAEIDVVSEQRMLATPPGRLGRITSSRSTVWSHSRLTNPGFR